MELNKVIKAFQAVENLTYMRTKKLKLARGLYILREALRPASTFFNEERDKIYKAHPGLNTQTGVVSVEGATIEENAEEARRIDREFLELENTEWELPENLPEIEIWDGDLIEAGIDVTGDMLGVLMPFITFKEAEPPKEESTEKPVLEVVK
jgi:hypothetical protein